MKTTVELPDILLERIKLRAVHHRRELKDEIATLLEAALAQASTHDAAARQPPKPVRLRGRKPLTLREIESAIRGGCA